VESLSQDVRGGGAGGAGRDDSERLTTREFTERGDGLMASSDPIYTTIRGYYCKHFGGGDDRPLWYASCPKCSKKVVGDDSIGHSCENCGWSGGEPSYRYILAAMVVDREGGMIMTAFNDQAQGLLGMKADELKRAKDTDTSRFESILQQAQWKPYTFRVRAKMDSYNGTSRLKSHVVSASKPKWAEEAKLLLADINKYELPVPTGAPPPVAADETSDDMPVKEEVGMAVKEEMDM